MLVWLLACEGFTKSEDSGVHIQQRPDDQVESNPSSEPSDEILDIDEDGYGSDVDCDDWNPNVYPGAQELWNFEDDDCDGYEDIDGRHSGTVALDAVGIYNGSAYDFSQECEVQIERVEGHLSMVITCTIDQTQPYASMLLGGQIVILSEADFVLSSGYYHDAQFVSTGGSLEWDAWGTVSLNWSDLELYGGDTINIYAVLDALYLDIQILGTAHRQ